MISSGAHKFAKRTRQLYPNILNEFDGGPNYVSFQYINVFERNIPTKVNITQINTKNKNECGKVLSQDMFVTIASVDSPRDSLLSRLSGRNKT